MRICCLRFQYKIYCLRGSVLMLFNILTLSISLLALISSFFIGTKQFELSKMQAAAQNKVELYLLCQPITLKDMDGRQPDKMVPSVSIINIGNNVIYLDKYSFNGREYPLGKEVLPPVSAYNGIHYIILPKDGTTHVSLEIDFYDWQNKHWKTKGYVDLRNGKWEITYSPCEPMT